MGLLTELFMWPNDMHNKIVAGVGMLTAIVPTYIPHLWYFHRNLLGYAQNCIVFNQLVVSL